MEWNLKLSIVEERSESLGDIILETEELAVLVPFHLMWLIGKTRPSQRLCIESLWTVSLSLLDPSVMALSTVDISSWSVNLWGVLIRIKWCFGKSTNPGKESESNTLLGTLHLEIYSPGVFLHYWCPKWPEDTVVLVPRNNLCQPSINGMLVAGNGVRRQLLFLPLHACSFSSCPLAMISECSNFWAWERYSEDVREGKNIRNSYWKSCLPFLWAWGRFKYSALP